VCPCFSRSQLFSISVVTNLVSPALGGELVKVRLIALTFCGMIVEFWHAGAKFCGIVLSFIEVTMAGTIILIVALLWFTPFISNVHRRIIVRAVLLVGRYCSQGLETMSMTRRTLGPNVHVPLDVTTQIRVEIEVGAYMDIISHFFVIAVLLSFIALLPGGFKNAPPRAESGRDYMMLAQDVAAGSVVVGFVVWLAFPFFHVVTTEVAATLIKPRNVYAEELFLDAGAPLLSILVFLLVFVAPVLQVVSHVMERKQRPNRFLCEFADALALVDVFLVALLVTFIWGIGKFVHHVVHYRFEDVCSALLETSGTDCLGLDVSLVASGSLGLFLAALGSFMLICTHAIQDVLRLDVETQWLLEDDSSAHLGTEGTELSKDVMPVSHSLHS